MVAGSFGTGDHLATSCGNRRESVDEGCMFRLSASRTSSPSRRARSTASCPKGPPASGSPARARGARCREGPDQQPVVALPAGELDRLFSKLPCRGHVNEGGDRHGGDQCRAEQRGVGAGVRPPQRGHRAARRPPAPGSARPSSGRARPPGAAPARSRPGGRRRAGRRAAGWPDRRPAGPASCPAPARSDRAAAASATARKCAQCASAAALPPPASASRSAANSRIVSSSRYRRVPPGGLGHH